MIFLLLLAELTWRERAPLPLPRAGYAIGVVDQRMLFAGGSHWEADRKIVSRRSDFFDPVSNAWTPGPELPAARCDAPSVTSGGHVYIFGGVVDGKLTDSVLQYSKGAWLEPSSMKLPEPRMYALAASAGKSLYVFGGLSKMGDLSSATSTLWRWRDGQGWQTLAAFPGSPRVIAALVAHHDQLYLFGGLSQSRNLREAWSYDPKTNAWKQLADLPVARRAWSAVSDGRNILLLGGYTDGFSDEIFLFDTKTAKPFGHLAHPLADAKYVIVGDRLLTAGGESGIKIRAPWTFETTLSQGQP
jgi:N-acetylneuraminic acid mutarotase